MKNIHDAYPLTPLQQGLLFHSVGSDGWDPYVQQLRCEIEGPLDEGALRSAWAFAAAGSAPLRTSFFWEGLSEPLQVVRAEVDLPWVSEDVSELEASQAEARVATLADRQRSARFDLARAPLVRLALVRRAPLHHTFLWTLHHLVLDGWSMAIVIGDVLDAYASVRAGRAPAPVERPPFRAFIAAQRRADPEPSRAFWRERLQGIGPAAKLFQGRQPLADDGEPFCETSRTLTPERTRRLVAFARSQRVTPHTLVSGVWSALLSKLSSRSDVLFGATVSGRTLPLPGIEAMVGVLINTLPRRVRVPERGEIGPWLRGLQAEQSRLHEHENVSLSELVQTAGRRPGEPLFESVLVFDNYPMEEQVGSGAGGLAIRDVRFASPNNYPLTLKVDDGDALRLVLKWDRRRLSPDVAERWLRAIQAGLEWLAEDCGGLDALLCAIPVERVALESRREGGRRPAPAWGVSDRVEAFAARTPEAVALRSGERRLSYAGLAARVRSAAAALRELGVGAEVPVGLRLRSGLDWPVAALAVCRAGGVFVPIDPEEPAARAASMLRDAGARVVIDEPGTPALEGRDLRRVELEALEARGGAPLAPLPRPTQLAYAIFTSGSTGRPKAVAVEHAQLAHYVDAVLQRLELDAPAAFAALGTPAADLGYTAVFGALASGGSLHLVPRETALDAARLPDVWGVRPDVLKVTPAHLEALLEGAADPAKLLPRRWLVSGGEPFRADLFDTARRHAPQCRVLNHYGPTETTIGALTYEVTSRRDGPTPIGTPLANVSAVLVDERQRPVPPGEPGDLWLGGRGVARGYLDGRGEVREAFVADPPFAPGRWYRTGDRALLDAEGFVFVGRDDDQVKIRGHRVELREIEHLLASLPDVRNAAVGVSGEGVEPRLVAHLELDADRCTLDRIRAQASFVLPAHMLPDDWTAHERLPLTANGKIDRKTLAAPTGAASSAARPEAEGAALSDLEREIAGIWGDLLGFEESDPARDFFDAGGHSLLAMKLVGRLREGLGVELSVNDFLEAPTIRALGRLVEAQRAAPPAASGPIRRRPRERRRVAAGEGATWGGAG